MTIRRSRTLLALSVVSALAIAACGDDDEETEDTAGTAAVDTASTTESDAGTPSTAADTTTAGTAADTTAASAETSEPDTTGDSGTSSTTESAAGTAEEGSEETNLSGICPDTVSILTDWNPEAEHGFIYELIGEPYEIDTGAVAVRGPLVASGVDTGVTIEIRSGGPAIGFQTVTSQLYADEDIFLGYVYTDEAIQNSAEFPTVAIESGLDKNPQMIMWDPETYPDVESIEDIGEQGILVRYFGGAAYMEYFLAEGILSADQVDGSYDGTPANFVADAGAAAQQGFASAEPYVYENEIEDWGKPLRYAYINDAGWENYAESIATRPENITEYADCFEKLVPMIQQATVDYVNSPEETNALIIDAVNTFDNGWVYSEGVAAYAVETMLNDGLIGNGTDDTIGNFDLDRVNGLIEKAIPVYESIGSPPKEGITAEDIVTNQFIDESIGL